MKIPIQINGSRIGEVEETWPDEVLLQKVKIHIVRVPGTLINVAVNLEGIPREITRVLRWTNNGKDCIKIEARRVV